MDDDDTTSAAPANFDEALGRTIQVLRTDQGQSRRDLADRAEISYSYLSAIENGTKASSSRTLAAISAALGVRRHELMGAAEARFMRTNSPLRDAVEPMAMYASEPLAERLPPSSNRGRVEELRTLLQELDDDDAEFLLQMARKLAQSGRRGRR